ncbi:ROK family protein [Pediococcus siamensis]|uniref:ROK family protein n=1 Tax=Pediococcus siamensis TaxID=381829 RepID=UPI0039A24FCE
MQKNFLSIDIGGTNLKYGVIDRSGNLLKKKSLPTPTKNLDEFLKCLFSIINQNISLIRGVAISCPGKIDTKKGIVHFGGSLPFLDNLNFKEEIRKRYSSLIISVTNDGKAAALAEQWLGSLKGIDNAAAIVLGTGVGGGIIVNGHLLQGKNFQAGELSFMVTDMKQSGLDQLVGFNGSAVNLISSIADKYPEIQKNDGIAVFKKIKKDHVANILFEQYCRRIAYLILNIQSVVDLEKYAIGGGISAEPIVVQTINKQYSQLLEDVPILSKTLTKPEIVKAYFENDANLYGALYGLLLELDKQEWSPSKIAVNEYLQ